MSKLTRKNFRAFLVKNKGKRVGQPSEDKCCPIATFLGQGAHVWPEEYTTRKMATHRALPKWAVNFVTGIDSDLPSKNKGYVTAGRALRILDQIK